MTLARLVWCFLPTRRLGPLLGGHSLGRYFVAGDILAFLVQAVGGVMASPTADPGIVRLGLNVYLGGLACQQIFIVVFLCLVVVFQRRAPDAVVDTDEEKPPAGGRVVRTQSWKSALYGIYAAIFFITVSAAQPTFLPPRIWPDALCVSCMQRHVKQTG